MGVREVKIRILRGFRDYTPGQVFDDWPGGMCEILIGQGFIEEVVEDEATEVAADEPSVERAEMPRRRKSK